jgi:hypothetical protein
MPDFDPAPLDRIRQRLDVAGATMEVARERVWGCLLRVNRSLELIQKLDRGANLESRGR